MSAEHVDAEIIETPAPCDTGLLVVTQMKPGLDIEANFEVFEARIAEMIADYEDVTVTRDYVRQAKKDRAWLNNQAKDLDAVRLRVKREYLRPVEVFEARVKRLLGPIKDASAAIDEQVKAFEEQEKAEKLRELADHYEAFAGILVDAVDFGRILDQSWLNKAVHVETAKKAIEEIVDRIAREEATLDELKLSHPAEAKATYFATLDMSAAIARSKALDEQEERARRFEAEKAEILAQREAERAERAAAEETAVEATVTDPAPEISEAVQAVPAAPVARTWQLTITCSQAELAQLIAFANSIGLTGTAKEV